MSIYPYIDLYWTLFAYVNLILPFDNSRGEWGEFLRASLAVFC